MSALTPERKFYFGAMEACKTLSPVPTSSVILDTQCINKDSLRSRTHSMSLDQKGMCEFGLSDTIG